MGTLRSWTGAFLALGTRTKILELATLAVIEVDAEVGYTNKECLCGILLSLPLIGLVPLARMSPQSIPHSQTPPPPPFGIHLAPVPRVQATMGRDSEHDEERVPTQPGARPGPARYTYPLHTSPRGRCSRNANERWFRVLAPPDTLPRLQGAGSAPF